MGDVSALAEIRTLIRTKLNIPQTIGDFVERPRLFDKLNRRSSRKATLLSAPAGYGKTTLVTHWLKQKGESNKVAWLSLDENDSNLGLFLGYFVAALQTIFPDGCPETNSLLQASPLPPIDYIATTLINEIAALPDTLPVSPNKAGFVLVLDDYHRIEGQSAVHQLMSKLIEYQPEAMHLVLISRQDPVSLPLAQLRARRDMLEIRQPDLRFDLAETRAFLAQTLELSLPDDTLALLEKWIEGWVAGLQLASLSIHDLNDPAMFVRNLKGTDRYVMEYLVDEVLSQQPEGIQTFLLQTSILDRFCGPLCEAVAGIDDPECNSQAYFEWLDQANLFLVALDNQHKWYRYHHLFQDLLAGRLEAEVPADKIQELHCRASHWFAGQGYVEEAIHHALAASDVELAVDVVEANSTHLLNRFEQRTLARWVSLLPEDVMWQRPKLLLVRAWLLYRQWRLTTLKSVLDRAEMLLESDVGPSTGQAQQPIVGQIQTLRSATAYVVDNDFQRSLIAGEQALQQLPPTAQGARSIALMMMASSQQALGRQDLAIRKLKQMLEDPTPHGPAKVQLFIGLSLLYLTAGDLPQMRQTIDHFQTFVTGNKAANPIVAANYLAGLLHYEWNNLKTTEAHFTEVVKLRFRANFMGGVNAGLGLVRVYQIRSDLEQAQEMIGALRHDTLRINNNDLLPRLEAAQAEQWLRQGDADAAMRWANSFQADVTQDKRFKFELPALIQTRILVSHGTEADVQAIQKRLETGLVDLETHHFTNRAIQTLAHLALVYNRLGLADDALVGLRRAITLAQPGGFIRSFVDCGPGLVPLLEQLNRQNVAPNYLPQVLAAFGTVKAISPLKRGSPHDPALMDPLTRREEEVLRLMETGLTDREIAAELVIAVSTVKRHASNIYNKLAVNNRRQAIRKARQLGLFPS